MKIKAVIRRNFPLLNEFRMDRITAPARTVSANKGSRMLDSLYSNPIKIPMKRLIVKRPKGWR
jgi:hypothetical protein